MNVGALQGVLYVTTGGTVDFYLVPDLSTPTKAAKYAERQLRDGARLDGRDPQCGGCSDDLGPSRCTGRCRVRRP